MTDQEFVCKYKGTRGWYIAFCVFLAVMVGVETWSMSWFWITLMFTALMRLAIIAAMLDRFEPQEKHERVSDAGLR